MRTDRAPQAHRLVGILCRDRLGLSDGINEWGLHASLIQGAAEAGPGKVPFARPLAIDGMPPLWMVRWLLETCRSKAEASRALRALRPRSTQGPVRLLIGDADGLCSTLRIDDSGWHREVGSTLRETVLSREEALEWSPAPYGTPQAEVAELVMRSLNDASPASPGLSAAQLAIPRPANGYRVLFDPQRALMMVQGYAPGSATSWHIESADPLAQTIDPGECGGTVGVEAPSQVLKAAKDGAWALVAQGRVDTNRDGDLRVHAWKGATTLGDAPTLWFVGKSGLGRPLDDCYGQSANGDFLLVSRRQRLVLIDSTTGSFRDTGPTPLEVEPKFAALNTRYVRLLPGTRGKRVAAVVEARSGKLLCWLPTPSRFVADLWLDPGGTLIFAAMIPESERQQEAVAAWRAWVGHDRRIFGEQQVRWGHAEGARAVVHVAPVASSSPWRAIPGYYETLQGGWLSRSARRTALHHERWDSTQEIFSADRPFRLRALSRSWNSVVLDTGDGFGKCEFLYWREGHSARSLFTEFLDEGPTWSPGYSRVDAWDDQRIFNVKTERDGWRWIDMKTGQVHLRATSCFYQHAGHAVTWQTPTGQLPIVVERLNLTTGVTKTLVSPWSEPPRFGGPWAYSEAGTWNWIDERVGPGLPARIAHLTRGGMALLNHHDEPSRHKRPLGDWRIQHLRWFRLDP